MVQADSGDTTNPTPIPTPNPLRRRDVRRIAALFWALEELTSCEALLARESSQERGDRMLRQCLSPEFEAAQRGATLRAPAMSPNREDLAPGLLNARQAAAYLNIRYTTLTTLVRDGVLTSIDIDVGKLLFDRHALDALIDAQSKRVA